MLHSSVSRLNKRQQKEAKKMLLMGVHYLVVCEKFGVGYNTLNRFFYDIMHSNGQTVGVCAFGKKTAYVEKHDDLTAEEQMLSVPYYNPLELKGAELEILNEINETK